MKKAYFSERIYKNEIDASVVVRLTEQIERFNQMKRTSYQSMVKEKRTGKSSFPVSLHLAMKNLFHTNDYYANSAVREAKALMSSQNELQTLYKKQKDEKIKNTNDKIKKDGKYLKKLENTKSSFVKGKPKVQKRMGLTILPDGSVRYQKKDKILIWNNLFLFEHQFLDVQIKRIQAKLGRIRHRQQRLTEEKEKLSSTINSVVFGTKKLFKHQHSKEEYVKDQQLWREKFLQQRNKQMLISGRKDGKYGNFVFHYNPADHQLRITLDSGVVVSLKVEIPYGQKIVDDILTQQLNCKNKKLGGQPISWSAEDHGAYYIFKCLVETELNPHINFSTADGVIGVDCNVNHFAWANVTKDGNYLNSGVINFNLSGKTTGQTTKIIELEVIALVDIAVKANKPIVIEDIDTTISKTGDAYGNKKANRLKSVFAYRKMAQAIHSRANKMGVDVKEVNPAYTSISGKQKYMRKFGLSTHCSAAYTIARSGLGYKEKVPKVLRYLLNGSRERQWKQWSILNKKLNVRTVAFYEMYDVKKPTLRLNIFVPCLSSTETNHLAKTLS